MDPSMEAEVTRLLARCREAWASARIEGERTRKLMDESCKLVAELMALEVFGPRPFRWAHSGQLAQSAQSGLSPRRHRLISR